MQNLRTVVFLMLTLTVFALTACGSTMPKQDWKVNIIPASLNEDNTLKLVEGYTQPIIVQLQARKEITDSASKHEISISFDLPATIKISNTEGWYLLKESSFFVKENRNYYNFQFVVKNGFILGEPGNTLRSESRTQRFFLDVGENLPKEQSYVSTILQWKDKKIVQNWPLSVEALKKTGIQPKLTRIGLWSYNYQTSDVATAEKFAQFLSASGVTYTQKVTNELNLALRKYGITSGGHTHQSAFYSPDYSDYDIKGKRMTGDFASPQDILELEKNAEIPGAKGLVENAKKYDGIATFDYEPSPLYGFSHTSISVFKKKYQISDEDFELLKQALIEHGRKIFLVKDSKIEGIYSKWVDFRTWHCAQYVRRLSEKARKHYPDIKIELTSLDTFKDDSTKTLALGHNAVAMARYVDAIFPQIYSGYGGMAVKQTMLQTRGWKESMGQQNVKSELCPILLVRYSGASVYNSPSRLRQQIIGTLAEGADGFLLYYPTGMDAPYWQMLAKTTCEINDIECFYKNGLRIDELFSLENMPQASNESMKWPGYLVKVENSQWHFTAHKDGNKCLLTLFNLEEANDLVFKINLPQGYKIINTEGAEQSGEDSSWLVKLQNIGFVTLEQK